MSSSRAAVVVHGATGFTGKLVSAALANRKIPFAIAGRSREKLDALAASLGDAAIESVVVDIRDARSVEAALEGRKVVCACAGPFIEVGEPVLAAAAKLGVHYADTTGEQKFVADAKARHDEIAKASGACVVPAMAYEIAIADWASHLAAEKIGGSPDAIDVAYLLKTPEGGMQGATSRGTKLSMIAMTADGAPKQWVDGRLVDEAAATHVRSFRAPSGREIWTASFPSPEAVVVPGHTGAKNVRTFMSFGKPAAKAMQLTRAITPFFMKLARKPLTKLVERSSAGPEGGDRHARFDVVAEATKGSKIERVFLSGSDPYGLTAEIQALFVEAALAGKLGTAGVVGPSLAVAPEEGIAALAKLGLTMS